MIKISGFENLPIENFTLKKNCGNHSLCEFTFSATRAEVSKLTEKVGEEIFLSHEGRRIFSGVIEEVSVEQTFHRALAKISARSATCKLDEKIYTRIFQNPEKTFGDVLNSTNLKLGSCKLSLDKNFSATKFSSVILQNRETNFSFINRLAAAANLKAWIIDTEKVAEIKICGYRRDFPETVSAAEIISFTASRREKNFAATLKLSKFIDVGKVIQVKGVGKDSRKYLIVSLEIFLENGAVRFFYTLEELQISAVPEKIFCGALATSFKAKVAAVQDAEHFGRVQVDFDKSDIEDFSEKKLWIPYHSTFGGILFLPEVGDSVEVFFVDEKCYAVAILQSAETLSGRNRIVLGRKKIEMVAGENILQLDERGLTYNGGEVKIASAQDVTISGATVKIGKKVELG